LKRIQKYFLLLLLLNLLLLLAAYLTTSLGNHIFLFSDVVILSFVFSGISVITTLIFLKGQTKSPESQVLYSLVAIGLKFLLEIILAFIWFVVAKKTSLHSVLIFFVLYLALTLFTVWGIMKALKNRAL
jgi:hypothetical protein